MTRLTTAQEKAPHVRERILKSAASKTVALIQYTITKRRLVYKNCVFLIATVLSFNKQRGFSCLRYHLVTNRLRSPCSKQIIYWIHSDAVFFSQTLILWKKSGENEVVAAIVSNLAATEGIEMTSCLKLYWNSDMQSVSIMRGIDRLIRKNSIVRLCYV